MLAIGKCERFLNEKYGKKDYISKKSIYEVRTQYRSRFGLLAIAGNYQHNNKFAKSNWLCRCEEAQEDETHLKGSSGEKHIKCVIKPLKICRLVAFLLFFLDDPFSQDRLPSVLE